MGELTSDSRITVGASLGGGGTFNNIEDGDYETAGFFGLQPDLGFLTRLGSRGVSYYECPSDKKICEEDHGDAYLRFELTEVTALGSQDKDEKISGTRVILQGGAGAEIHRVLNPVPGSQDPMRFVLQLTGGIATKPIGEIGEDGGRWGGYVNSGFFLGGVSFLFGFRLTSYFFPDELNLMITAGPRIDF